MHNLFRGTFISVKVRLANLSDAEEIANIYNHEVLSGVATFDLVPKTLDEQREWLRERSGALPCIVALNDSRKVVGWACLSKYRDRPAYGTSVEDSVMFTGASGRRRRVMLLSELVHLLMARLSCHIRSNSGREPT